MRLSVALPSGRVAQDPGSLPAIAAGLEEVGWDGLWISDHVLMPATTTSDYPFAKDRRPTWDLADPWYDAIVLLAAAAAATKRIALGTSVLVAPLRHPLVVAKQIASIDRIARGRVRLGIGTGWLAEEFAALGLRFADRGAMTDEWIEVVRSAWTGAPSERFGRHYPVPPGLQTAPTPAGPVPVLVGGTSRAALRRAARVGDGWIGHEHVDELDLGSLADAIAAATPAAPRGRFSVVLRLVGTARRAEAVGDLLPALHEIGVGEVVVDAASPAEQRHQLAVLRTASTGQPRKELL